MALLPSTRGRVAGLLSLRSDRADRTLQWVTALRGEARTWFDPLFILGRHAAAARRALGWGQVIAGEDPDKIMASVTEGLDDRDVVFGFGNLGGKGRELVDLWETRGEEHGQ
jgi:UDP-N-acetylmuramyl pentapeptide synthase